MRLLITAGIYPPEIGGPATYVPAIARELVKRGLLVSVVAPINRNINKYPEEKPFDLVRYQRSKKIRFINFFVEFIRAVTTIYQESRNVDLLFSNSLDMPSYLVSKLRKIPLVIKVVGDSAWEFTHSHSIAPLDFETFQFSHLPIHRFIKLYFRYPLIKADCVIVPSQFMAKIVLRWGISQENIHVIPNALLESTIPTPYPVKASMMKGFKVLSAGRLLPLKCFDQIITCISKIPETKLIIAGDGPDYKKLLELIHDLELNDRVVLTGRISKGELFYLFKNFADLFILNSLHETFPHILLEAISCSIPIIATNVGGIPEIINSECGILIPPNMPNKLFDAIQQFKSDCSLREKMIQNSKNCIADFSIKNMTDKTMAIFERVV